MEDGLLSLKWNNHKATFLETFRHFREKGLYTDATLAVEGKCYPVHKVVLSTCSDYFNDIFERTSCKCPVIVLKDVRSQDLDSLLDYMYFGEVNVRQNELPILINTAESLKIKGLAMSDEDSSRHSRNSNSHNEDFREVPPSKRKREDTVQLPALSPHKTASTTTAQSEQTRNSSSPSSPQVENNTLVKVEMNENDETEDDRFQSSITEENSDNRDHLLEKSDSEPSSFSASNFSIPPTHQAGEISWDEGDASFPSDGFSVDQSNQQTGGVPYSPAGTRRAFLNLSDPERRWDRTCQLCSRVFVRPADLKRHMRSHTGERPYACHFCPWKGLQSWHLKSHIKRRHQNSAACKTSSESSRFSHSPLFLASSLSNALCHPQQALALSRLLSFAHTNSTDDLKDSVTTSKSSSPITSPSQLQNLTLDPSSQDPTHPPPSNKPTLSTDSETAPLPPPPHSSPIAFSNSISPLAFPECLQQLQQPTASLSQQLSVASLLLASQQSLD